MYLTQDSHVLVKGNCSFGKEWAQSLKAESFTRSEHILSPAGRIVGKVGFPTGQRGEAGSKCYET